MIVKTKHFCQRSFSNKEARKIDSSIRGMSSIIVIVSNTVTKVYKIKTLHKNVYLPTLKGSCEASPGIPPSRSAVGKLEINHPLFLS